MKYLFLISTLLYLTACGSASFKCDYTLTTESGKQVGRIVLSLPINPSEIEGKYKSENVSIDYQSFNGEVGKKISDLLAGNIEASFSALDKTVFDVRFNQEGNRGQYFQVIASQDQTGTWQYADKFQITEYGRLTTIYAE